MVKDDSPSIKFYFGRDKLEGLVSLEDADLVNLSWGKSNGYAMGCQKNEYLGMTMSRVILERKLGRKLSRFEFADHINLIRSDNRRSNIRLSNSSLNQANRGITKRSTTGFKGVYLDISVVRKNGKKPYRATLIYNKKTINLGNFSEAKEAALAYNKKAIELFGDYAFLNEVN